MELRTIYEYAYWGVIDKLKTLTKLYNMCIEVGDGDASEEYEIAIEKIKSDFNIIISALGYDAYESWLIAEAIIKGEF